MVSPQQTTHHTSSAAPRRAASPLVRTLGAVCSAYVVFTPVATALNPDLTKQGGGMTTTMEGHNAIQIPGPAVTSQERWNLQISGFSLFHRTVERTEGLGPRFVNNSCGGCHVQNGRGPISLSLKDSGLSAMIIKVAQRKQGRWVPIDSIGPQLQQASVTKSRYPRARLSWDTTSGLYPDGTRYNLRKPRISLQVAGIAPQDLAVSLRMSPQLIGMGLLGALSDSTLRSLEDPTDRNLDGISGRINLVDDIRRGAKSIGRFGFKAIHPSIEQQTAAAAFLDIGLTNPLFSASTQETEMSEDQLRRLVVYQAIAGVPAARDQDNPRVIAGRRHFISSGCHECHRTGLKTGNDESIEPELRNQVIHPFTDLLLHNMGPGLADRVPQGTAAGQEWRTTPLWGIGFSETLSDVVPRYLHDGRARSLEEAILWHDGEARASATLFKNLSRSEREELITFLRSL